MSDKAANRNVTTLRMSRDMRFMIERAAEQAGRSLSQEIELRLDRTFQAEALAREIVEVVRQTAAEAEFDREGRLSPCGPR